MNPSQSFLSSTSGRLISTSISLALLGGGAASLMQQPTSLYVMSLSSFVAVVGCISALELAIEDFPGHALLSIIALPILLFLYAIGLGFVMTHFTSGGYALLALGAAALLVAVRSFTAGSSAAPRVDRPISSAHAPQH